MDGSVINKEGIEVIDLFVLKIDEEYSDNQFYPLINSFRYFSKLRDALKIKYLFGESLHSSLLVSLIPVD
jgi:hypothetical protein